MKAVPFSYLLPCAASAGSRLSRESAQAVAVPGPIRLSGPMTSSTPATAGLLGLTLLLALSVSVPGISATAGAFQTGGPFLAHGAASTVARARGNPAAPNAGNAGDPAGRGILAQNQTTPTGQIGHQGGPRVGGGIPAQNQTNSAPGILPQGGPRVGGGIPAQDQSNAEQEIRPQRGAGSDSSEIRAVWMEFPEMEEVAGNAALRGRMIALAGAGLNTVFFWCPSTVVEAVRDSSHTASSPLAAWDALGVAVRQGHAAGMKIHAWYSPARYKETFRAVELQKHPDWAAVDSTGRPSDAAVCLARPEAREYELLAVMELVRRHPDLDGVHVEEPGYPSGPYCFCNVCRDIGRQLLGFDIKTRPTDSAVAALKSFVCTEFVRGLRERLSAEAPRLTVSANGGFDPASDFQIGRDWETWARRGYLDFYVPQIYTNSERDFVAKAASVRDVIGAGRVGRQVGETSVFAGRGAPCLVVPGIVVSHTAFMPKRESTGGLIEQIEAARSVGSAGFALFSDAYLTVEELEALSKLRAAGEGK